MAVRSRKPLKVAGSKAPTTQQMTQGMIGGLPNVQYVRQELRDVLHLYDLVQDCIGGSHAVKGKTTKYLPQPNPTDTSEQNIARYKAYVMRALYYNVTRRTVFALVGQIFLRQPQVDVPAGLQVLNLDATGENVTLSQVAQKVAQDVLSVGRSGLHVDFPTTDATITLANATDYRPTITSYNGRDIVNWRKALRGARTVYTLIVVKEDYTTGDDGFEAKTGSQYKVMRLIPKADLAGLLTVEYPNDDNNDALNALDVSDATDVYRLEVWRGDTDGLVNGNGSFALAQAYYPKGSNGQFLNEIPWMFVGAEQNDDSVDHPPMADLAEVNIAHYRNSADYEESVFLVGQPTPYVSGVTEEWNANVLKGTIQLGSRGVIALPNGGTAGLLQADENKLVSEAMAAKERQMVALGAKLVEQRQVQRTATEAQMEGTADTSILANIAANVGTAIQWALKKACVFTGDSADAVSFILNTEFDLTRMDPQERAELLEEWVSGAIAFTEMRANLRRGGVATLDDAEALTAINKEQAQRQADKLAAATAMAAAQPTVAVAPGAPSNIQKKNQTASKPPKTGEAKGQAS